MICIFLLYSTILNAIPYYTTLSHTILYYSAPGKRPAPVRLRRKDQVRGVLKRPRASLFESNYFVRGRRFLSNLRSPSSSGSPNITPGREHYIHFLLKIVKLRYNRGL